MSTQELTSLADILNDCGLGWLIDWHEPSEQAIPHLLERLARVQAEADRRLGANAVDFSETALVAAYKQFPLKITAFLQALHKATPAMLLMAWRVIQGMDLRSIDLQYEEQRRFTLRITLASPYGETDEPYESTEVYDASLLRHFGITSVNGAPLMNGFYPLRMD